MKALSRRGFIEAAGGALLTAPAVRAQSAATVTADLAAPGVPRNPMLFGQFLEHFHRQVYSGVFDPGSRLANREGFREDVITALRELKIPIVRWPGGCFASAYHWQDGVGRNRQPSFDKAWCVEEPNTFGTDEFMKWCRAIGAEPYICTNAGTGTPEEMSNWVEYCNLKNEGRYARMRQANGFSEPHNVRFWSIGNENYFGTEIGAKPLAEWGPLVRESAKLMRAVEPNIKLLAAATTKGNWTALLLQEAGKFLDYISIHGYWDPLWQVNKPSDYVQCMLRSEEPERQIREAIALLDQAGFRNRIRIAFDEWNLRGWHHPPGHPGGGPVPELIARRDENDRNETYTMADAVFSATFLNTCLRHAQDVHMACMAPVVNVRGPLYVHPKGVVKRTTFHVLEMYAQLLEPNVVPTQVSSEPLKLGEKQVPALDAVITRSGDRRRFAMALANRHPDRAMDCKLNLSAVPADGAVEVRVLAGDSPDDFNDVAHPNSVAPETHRRKLQGGSLQLPPHSIAIIRGSV